MRLELVEGIRQFCKKIPENLMECSLGLFTAFSNGKDAQEQRGDRNCEGLDQRISRIVSKAFIVLHLNSGLAPRVLSALCNPPG